MVGVFTGAQAYRLLSSAKLNPETIAVATTVQEQPPPTFGDEEKWLVDWKLNGRERKS